MKITASSRLRLRDVLILHMVEIAPEEESSLTQLAENLSGVCRIPVIILRNGMTIESLSEQDMVKAGWVRIERRTANGG